MAEGRSNQAIASRLVISEKAVSKHTNNIFTKLDLWPDGDDNRRVLAVLTYLRAAEVDDEAARRRADRAAIVAAARPHLEARARRRSPAA